MKMLSKENARELISSTEFYMTLAKLVARSPSTMRKTTPFTVKPEGFILTKGIAVKMYSKKSLALAIDHFTKNPPKGSGRPKGSLNRKKP